VGNGFRTSLLFGWWNTSLAPLAKYRSNEAEKAFAMDIIQRLMNGYEVDCLALGEITADLLQDCLSASGLTDYSAFDCTAISGRLRFDVGVIFRTSRLKILDQSTITSAYGDSAIKIAQRLTVELPKGERPLYLFVVHWPSRLWCPENGAKRNSLGICLRMAVESVLVSAERPPPVVILGDFNDDPFNASLAGHLLATRDRSKAQTSASYFYNPFWRFLGESDPHKPRIACDSICGTYLQQHGGDETRWRTFDQIIVSSGLLTSDEWQLNEQDTTIVRIPELIEAVKSKQQRFDHLPVVARIEM